MSGLYSTAPRPPRLEAVPTDQDFIAALKALGLDPCRAAKAGDGNQTSLQQEASLQDAGPQLLARGTMYHLQLLLRTFAAVCNYKQQVFETPGASLLCCLLKLFFLQGSFY